MAKKALTLLLLLSVATRAQEKFIHSLECLARDGSGFYEADGDAAEFRSCRCKRYECLEVGTLTVRNVAAITNFQAVNQVIAGDVSTSGNINAGNETLTGTLNVAGNINSQGNLNLGSGAVLTQAFLNQLIALSSFGSFSNAAVATGAIADNAPVVIPTVVSSSVNNPVTNPIAGQFITPAGGNYNVSFSYATTTPATQLTLYVNGIAVPGAVFTAVGANNVISGNVVVNAPIANSNIQLRNSSGLPFTPDFTNINPSLVIQRVP